MVSKNTKKMVAVVVVVVLVLGIVLGLYFGLRNTNGHHTTPTNPHPKPTPTNPHPKPTPTNPPPAPVPVLPSGTIVVYGDAFLIHDASVPSDPICTNNNFDTYKISYKTRDLISYKQNTLFPTGQIYLSNKGTLWFKYNTSNGLFELNSSGTQITQFTGKILATTSDGFLLVYLPFSQLPASIKSLMDYNLTSDYYRLIYFQDGVELDGLGNVNVIKNQLCMRNPPSFTLKMYNPTTTTTKHHK